MMKGFVFALLFVLQIIKVTHGQGELLVKLDIYTSKDTTTNCIKFCVTTSPSGFPRCNLNTTTGTSTTEFRTTRKLPNPYIYRYKFTEWEYNSELSATVWKRPPGQSCDTSAPTNSTSYGEGSIIIPRLEGLKIRYMKTDKWDITVNTMLTCDNPGCLLPCTPRDNSTGHYTCLDGNKKCLAKWYGRNCLKTCVKPTDPPGNYKCSKTGEKGCLTNWFGENCTTFCDTKSPTYQCDVKGHKICFQENWFGTNCSKFCDNSSKTFTCNNTGQKHCKTNYHNENCSTFCNSSASTYNCNKIGEKICLKNWYGRNCTIFCNTTKENYQCSSNGSIICESNWFGNVCDKFCNISAENYICTRNGSYICKQNWFGKNCDIFCDENAPNYRCSKDGRRSCFPSWFKQDCSKFCDLNATNYNCSDNGERICVRNWFRNACETFCNESSTRHKCLSNGTKSCLPNWYGNECSIYCDDTIGNSYTCNGNGKKLCFKNWYGENCTKFCNQTLINKRCDEHGEIICNRDWFGDNCITYCNAGSGNYKCSNTGKKLCFQNWYGPDCGAFCDNTTSHYICDNKGKRICLQNWYGTNCTKFCDTTSNTYNCSNDGEIICLVNWYGEMCSVYCEENAATYRCENNGKKTCSRNWYGDDCAVFCNTSSVSYTCDERGEQNCLPNWFGKNCSTFCNNSSKRYVCNEEGHKVCLPKWFGKNCSTFCDNSLERYMCSDEDIDECKNESLCSSGKECVNTIGSYFCREVIPGFETYTIILRLNDVYTSGLSSNTSGEFEKFERRMKSAMAKVHENNNAYHKVEIIQLNNGSIIANLLLTFTDQNTQGLTELFAAIRNSSFGDFSVDPDALTVVIRGACPYDKCPGNSTCKQLTADTIACPCDDGYYYDGVSCIEFTKIKVEVSLEKEFTNDLKNKSSEAYKSLERNVTAELHERFKDTPNFEEVRVSGFSNGSVVVKFSVHYRQGEMTKVVVGEELKKIIQTGKLAGYKVTGGLVKAPPPAPEKLILADVTHNRIEIQWTKPIAHLAFEIKGYTISHKTVAETTFKTDEFDSDSTNSVLGDLESDTFYVIQIRAKNDEGTGEEREMQVSTEKPPESTTVPVTIIIIVIVVVLLLIIGMVVFFHLRKRRHLQEVRQRAHAQAQMPNPIPLSTTQYDNFGQGDEEAHGSQKL